MVAISRDLPGAAGYLAALSYRTKQEASMNIPARWAF